MRQKPKHSWFRRALRLLGILVLIWAVLFSGLWVLIYKIRVKRG